MSPWALGSDDDRCNSSIVAPDWVMTSVIPPAFARASAMRRRALSCNSRFLAFEVVSTGLNMFEPPIIEPEASRFACSSIILARSLSSSCLDLARRDNLVFDGLVGEPNAFSDIGLEEAELWLEDGDIRLIWYDIPNSGKFIGDWLDFSFSLSELVILENCFALSYGSESCRLMFNFWDFIPTRLKFPSFRSRDSESKLSWLATFRFCRRVGWSCRLWAASFCSALRWERGRHHLQLIFIRIEWIKQLLSSHQPGFVDVVRGGDLPERATRFTQSAHVQLPRSWRSTPRPGRIRSCHFSGIIKLKFCRYFPRRWWWYSVFHSFGSYLPFLLICRFQTLCTLLRSKIATTLCNGW